MFRTFLEKACGPSEVHLPKLVLEREAFRQRREDKRDKEAPWNTSRDASRRAKELLEKSNKQEKNERPDVSVKAVRNLVAQAAWGLEVKRPLREELEDPSSSLYEDSSEEKEDIDAPVGGKEI